MDVKGMLNYQYMQSENINKINLWVQKLMNLKQQTFTNKYYSLFDEKLQHINELQTNLVEEYYIAQMPEGY